MVKKNFKIGDIIRIYPMNGSVVKDLNAVAEITDIDFMKGLYEYKFIQHDFPDHVGKKLTFDIAIINATSHLFNVRYNKIWIELNV